MIDRDLVRALVRGMMTGAGEALIEEMVDRLIPDAERREAVLRDFQGEMSNDG